MERNGVCLDGKERRGGAGAAKWCAMENNWVITYLPIPKKGLYFIPLPGGMVHSKKGLLGVLIYDFTFNIQDESCLLNIYTKKLQKRTIEEFEELNRVHLYSHKSLTEADGVPTLSMLKASVVLCRKCSE
jgi:hypothetical protein